MTETTIENIVKRVHTYVNLVQRQVVYSVAVFYSEQLNVINILTKRIFCS